MGSIALPGVLSGMDTSSIVSQLLASDSGPLNRLKAQKATLTQQQAAFVSIQQAFQQISSTIEDLRNAKTLQAVSASSSDTDILTVTSSNGASEGTYQIEVNRLASAQRLVHTAGLASADTLVGTGAFVYTYDGVTRTIHTTDTTTLANLRDLINNDSSNPGVSASLIQVGSQYHLMLGGHDTGSDHAITINDAGTTLAGFDTADFTVTQNAQSAQFRVDGFPAASWIERDSNSISDVIGGVTLNLQNTGTSSVTVKRDTAAITGDIQALVAKYNSLVDTIKQNTSYDATTKKAGVLQGDSLLAGAMQTVRQSLVGVPAGFEDGEQAYTMAAQLGIEVDRYGKLQLDTSKLNAALKADPDSVLALLGGSATGDSSSEYIQFNDASDFTTAGEYEIQVDFDVAGKPTAARMRAKGEVAWRDAAVNGDFITGAAGKPEQDLQVLAAWDGVSATQSATVHVRQGIGGQLHQGLKGLLDSTSGSFVLKTKQFDTSMTSLDKKIQTQQDRLAAEEKRLKAQYARLEKTLSDLQSQSGQFDSLFQSLAANNANSSNS